jgi:hypothetical protein
LMLNGICHAAGESTMTDVAGRAASALGISDGPVVAEIVTHQGTPYVTEISVRLCGSAFLTAATRLALGETVSPQDLEA